MTDSKSLWQRLDRHFLACSAMAGAVGLAGLGLGDASAAIVHVDISGAPLTTPLAGLTGNENNPVFGSGVQINPAAGTANIGAALGSAIGLFNTSYGGVFFFTSTMTTGGYSAVAGGTAGAAVGNGTMGGGWVGFSGAYEPYVSRLAYGQAIGASSGQFRSMFGTATPGGAGLLFSMARSMTYTPSFTTMYTTMTMTGSGTMTFTNTFPAASMSGVGTFGPWASPGAGYIGFRFDDGVGTGTNYGWALVTVTGYGAITLFEFAYETTDGLAIAAGDRGTGGGIPEPSSMALTCLTLGAAGLSSWRRRKNEEKEGQESEAA